MTKIKLAFVPVKGHTEVAVSDLLEVFISDVARKEIRTWPLDVRQDLGAILTKLQMSKEVGFPDSSPMKTIAKGVFKLRVKDRSGIYRAFYVAKTELGIVVFHSFKKKSQKTPQHEIETGRLRLQSYLKELDDESN